MHLLYIILLLIALILLLPLLDLFYKRVRKEALSIYPWWVNTTLYHSKVAITHTTLFLG